MTSNRHEQPMCCPNCGSGDVSICLISVRPHCNECKYWGSINYVGTIQDAINKWNNDAIKAGRKEEAKMTSRIDIIAASHGDGEHYDLPSKGEIYRNENGNKYTVIGVGNLHLSNPDYPLLVAYIDHQNERMIIKPLERFIAGMTKVKS